MPISKVDLNWTVPGNTFQLPISTPPSMAIKGHTPWPATSNLPGDPTKISWRPVTVFFPDVHTSNHAIGTTATFTKIPTQSQAAWVNESPCAKVFKNNRKKNACWSYIVIMSQKTFQNLGCSPIRCTKNEQLTEEWALFLVMSARLKLGRLWFGTFCPSTFCTLAQRPPCPRCT